MAVMVGAPVLALTGAGYLCAALGWGDTARLIIAGGILFFGLLANYFGIKVTGQLQIAVVVTTLGVLITTIAGSFYKIDPANFKPFMPHGWVSVGSALTILFWCVIGWEAVSNMSGEFQNPEKDAVKGTIIAAVVISLIYFLTALVIVGTHSYGPTRSDTSLIYIIQGTFGKPGAVIAGFAALFVCMAPAIAYIGAIARMVYSLSENGYAPKALASLSGKYKTPLGGLCFLAMGFTLLLVIFSTRMVSLATLIQIPNATFILTYAGACAAGIKLLKNTKGGVVFSLISLVFSILVFFWVKWSVLYPVIITLFWLGYMQANKRRGN